MQYRIVVNPEVQLITPPVIKVPFFFGGGGCFPHMKFFSHRSLDQGFQNNLAADEPNEETRPEVKTPNPGKRRKKKDKNKKKDCTSFFLVFLS